MGSKIITKVVLDRRVIKQPIPQLNDGGDCGACVLGGLLDLGGDSTAQIGKIYVAFCESEAKSISQPKMLSILGEIKSRGLVEEFIHNVPIWQRPDSVSQFGSPGWTMASQWYQYIKMAIRAGYYGMAMVTSKGRGNHAELDHWVMICGFRQREIPNPHTRNSKDPKMRESTIITQEILISNSSIKAKDERWIETRDFLKRFGGYNAILVLLTKKDK